MPTRLFKKKNIHRRISGAVKQIRIHLNQYYQGNNILSAPTTFIKKKSSKQPPQITVNGAKQFLHIMLVIFTLRGKVNEDYNRKNKNRQI